MDPNTGAPPSDPASTTTTNTPSPSDWTTGFDADTLNFVQTKGFKAPADVISSYRNLEKLHGVGPDKLVRLPTDDNPDAWNQVYSRLGRPESADQYDLNIPEGGGDGEFQKWARSTFHEAGLSNKQAKAISAKWNELAAAESARQAEQYRQKIATEESALKSEWGQAFDANINAAKRAAATFGLTPETIDALEDSMGFAGLMKFMHGIGSRLGEDAFVSGDGGTRGGFSPTNPQQAQARINTLKQDKAFVARYASGDVEARAEMERLHKVAYPGS